jgi:hypothetical protein
MLNTTKTQTGRDSKLGSQRRMANSKDSRNRRNRTRESRESSKGDKSIQLTNTIQMQIRQETKGCCQIRMSGSKASSSQ